MGTFVDLRGRKFGLWTVIRMQRNGSGTVMWLCRCVCGKERLVKAASLNNGSSRSCGGCGRRGRSYPKKTRAVVSPFSEAGRARIEQRLLSRRRVTDSGCWEYTLSGPKGYGAIDVTGLPTRLVHRIAAWLWLGFDIHSELFVCHHCDNGICFNPAHLFVGDQTDNMRDAADKNRFGDRTVNYQSRKTHCPRGHAYSAENTYITGKGHRQCKTCMQARNRRRYSK